MRRGGVLAAMAAAVGVVAVYLWDDVIFAAPVIAVNRAWGTWPAFLLFSVVYSVGSFVLALVVVSLSERHEQQHDEPGRITRWLRKESTRPRGVWGTRLVATGSVIAFFVSSVVVGGILTTWLVWLTGRRQHMVATAALSSVIFGVMFTATYTGVVEGIARLV